MNKTKKVISVLVLIVIVTFIVMVNKDGEAKNLTFGLISGTTGDYAVVGESFNKGALLAQEKWNSEHPDMQINIIAENDAFDGKKGLSAYQKLVSVDKVDGLINMTTVTIDTIYDNVVDAQIPVALGFEQGIEAVDDNVVQLWPGSVPAEIKLGEHIKEKGYKNIVVFVDNGSSAFQRFADGFKKGYGSAVTELKVAADGTDIRTNALKAVSSKSDAIVFIVRPTSGALLVKEINALAETKIQYVFDANIQTGFTDYVTVLGDANILNGSILYTVPENHREEFKTAFKNKYGSDPAIGSETGYNAFMLLALTYDKDRKDWIENMQEATFEGADGTLRFDENGVRIPDLKIGTIENGALPK